MWSISRGHERGAYEGLRCDIGVSLFLLDRHVLAQQSSTRRWFPVFFSSQVVDMGSVVVCRGAIGQSGWLSEQKVPKGGPFYQHLPKMLFGFGSKPIGTFGRDQHLWKVFSGGHGGYKVLTHSHFISFQFAGILEQLHSPPVSSDHKNASSESFAISCIAGGYHSSEVGFPTLCLQQRGRKASFRPWLHKLCLHQPSHQCFFSPLDHLKGPGNTMTYRFFPDFFHLWKTQMSFSKRPGRRPLSCCLGCSSWSSIYQLRRPSMVCDCGSKRESPREHRFCSFVFSGILFSIYTHVDTVHVNVKNP